MDQEVSASEWRQQVELAVQQMSAMTPQERQEYLAEVELWDTTSSDGLSDD
ncbi:MAG: hypothetical protein ACKOW5_03030 [Actinomycetales bacterium]